MVNRFSPQKISDSLAPLVKGQGYNVSTIDLRSSPRGSLWREKDGQWTELKNLPLDPFHLQKYLARGFKLDPPETLPSSDRLPYLSLDPDGPTQLSFDDIDKKPEIKNNDTMNLNLDEIEKIVSSSDTTKK